MASQQDTIVRRYHSPRNRRFIFKNMLHNVLKLLLDQPAKSGSVLVDLLLGRALQANAEYLNDVFDSSSSSSPLLSTQRIRDFFGSVSLMKLVLETLWVHVLKVRIRLIQTLRYILRRQWNRCSEMPSVGQNRFSNVNI